MSYTDQPMPIPGVGYVVDETRTHVVAHFHVSAPLSNIVMVRLAEISRIGRTGQSTHYQWIDLARFISRNILVLTYENMPDEELPEYTGS
jgi:hypothetical protein